MLLNTFMVKQNAVNPYHKTLLAEKEQVVNILTLDGPQRHYAKFKKLISKGRIL